MFYAELLYHHDFPDVIFNIKEIELLLQADIYEVVNKFLNRFFKDGTLNNYSIIKLTGQSCRIDIFREALKEFIGNNINEYCSTCKTRFEKNPMRILDCKENK